MQRKDAVASVNEFKVKFEQFVNKPVCISFGRFKDCGIIIEHIILDTVTAFNMKALILDAGGKTKPIWTIITNKVKITIPVEDTQIVFIMNGIRILVGTYEINIIKCEDIC